MVKDECIGGRGHDWDKPVFRDWSVHSRVLDWRQKCTTCGKVKTWVQPKGDSIIYEPISWSPNKNKFKMVLPYLLATILIILLIIILKKYIG